MSKTYTLPCTLQGWQRATSSSTLNYTTKYSSYAVGHNSSDYFAISVTPTDSDTMQYLYNLYAASSSNITSIKLKITVSSLSYNYSARIGPLNVLPTKGSTITSNNGSYSIQAGTSKTTTVDITSRGITNKLGYGIGNYSSSTTVRFMVESVSLVIVTTESTYVLSYNANGGTGAPSSQTGTGIGSYTFTVSNTTPSREGYGFLGWNLSSTATTASYHGGDSITITSNKTLYAVWLENTSYCFHYYNGSTLLDCELYYYNGTELLPCELYYFDGTSLIKTS